MILSLLVGLMVAAPPQDTGRVPMRRAQDSARVVGKGARDSTRTLTKRARNAESSYERVSRTRAPVTFGSYGTNCDEIVGRFCLTFDPNEFKRHIPPMPPVVGSARTDAIGALERAAAAAPGDSVTARALVRLLVESHRDGAALAAALRYRAAAGGAWGDLLEGFARHALGEDTAAATRFRGGFAAMPERERKRLNPEHLVSEDEEGRFRHLPDSARAGYEAALWKLADPLYLTPGNEVLGEHWARYVWGRMLADVRPVAGMVSWGDDLEELTFRYGVPQSRERVPAPTWEVYDNYVEHFDSTQRAFLPESLLTVGVRETPEPGTGWTLDDPFARSAYAPPRGVRHDTTLAVQVTRFPVGDSVVLRIDGAFPLDSVARHSLAGGTERVQLGLFLLPGLAQLLHGDTAIVRAETTSAAPPADTARLAFTMTLPAGAYIYSAEALEPASGLAGRARFAVALLPALVSDTRLRLTLSDILLTHPLLGARPAGRDAKALHALAEPVALAGDTIGLYAEVAGLDTTGAGRYHLALELRRAGGPPGKVLGLFRRGPGRAVRVTWTEELHADARPGARAAVPRPGAPTVVATDLALPTGLPPGLYELVLRVSKPGSEPASATRLIRINKRA